MQLAGDVMSTCQASWLSVCDGEVSMAKWYNQTDVSIFLFANQLVCRGQLHGDGISIVD